MLDYIILSSVMSVKKHNTSDTTMIMSFIFPRLTMVVSPKSKVSNTSTKIICKDTYKMKNELLNILNLLHRQNPHHHLHLGHLTPIRQPLCRS